MNITIFEIVQGIATQQIPALQTILTKAKDYASESGTNDKTLLDARLHPDMHPLFWQIQTTLELILRGVARLSGQEPTNLTLDEDTFAALIPHVEAIRIELSECSPEALNKNTDETFTIPIGPDAKLTLTGRDYLIKFLLPNFYFHLTTTYDILRMNGVPLGKRDFLGPMLP